MSKELDLAQAAADQREDKISGDLDALGEKDILTVSCNEDFSGVIAELKKKRGRSFIWTPLSAGPDIWKGEILKTGADDTVHASVIDFMSFDHKRCDDLYAAGESLAMEGNWDQAAEQLKAFVLGMRRHFFIEQEILFPAFTEATGMTGGPVQVMIMEHDQMKSVLDKMEEAISADDFEAVTGLGETLLILMQQHNVKEEGILYPMIDQHLQGEAEELIKRAQLAAGF